MSEATRTSAAPKRNRPPPAAAAPPGVAARRGWHASARFYVCVAILAAAAGGLEGTARMLGRHFRKEAVPLKRPLATMDPRKLAPEYALHLVLPPPLSEDVIETLGTREYLQWRVVDQVRDQDDPTATAHVFVTYYTGQPDMVPHEPDECMAALGYERVGAPRHESVAAAGVGAPDERVPVRILTFEAPRRAFRSPLYRPGADKTTVVYFFHVNGRYARTRNEVRLLQADPRDRYAYYAKIEIHFSDYSGQRRATTDESIAALGPLLKKIMTILLEDHFQDLKTWTPAARPPEQPA